jgi:hypothetical protein
MLVEPPEGFVVVELDYGSEEVYIAACVGGDKNLRDTYLSKDVYVYYCQLIGMYPADLPIPDEEERGQGWFKPYKSVRQVGKGIFLSRQFGSGGKSLASTVRDLTKNPDIDEDWGYDRVREYEETYAEYTELNRELREAYKPKFGEGMGIMLRGGWRMGKDNPSVLSAANLPVQGLGAMILQLACRLADDRGLHLIATLHDAITMLCPKDRAQRDAQMLKECMTEAAYLVLGDDGMKVGAPEIVEPGHLWIHSEKAQAAWDRIGKYFQTATTEDK